MRRSRIDSALLFLTALAAGAFLGARDPGAVVRASLLSGFELESIATQGVEQVPAAEVARATGLVPGMPLAEVDPARVEARLLRHPWIREARVAPLPPARVLVEVAERQPRVAVELGQPARLWLVDGSGTPFVEAGDGEADGLARVHGVTATPGEASRALAEVIRLSHTLEARGLPALRALWLGGGDEGPALALRGVPGRVVLGTGPLPPKLERLARLLAGAPGEVAAAATIDLRFGDRVVLRSGAAELARGGRKQPGKGRSG